MVSKNKKYAIVRGTAGVFAGYIESIKGIEVIMTEVRCLWYYAGAASLNQLAMEGVKKPQDCKFTVPATRIRILNTLEILDCSEAARKNIEGVPVWKQ